MTDYIYKGFKVFYKITESSETNLKLYQADGYVVKCLESAQSPDLPQKFHTEYPTKTGAENEIKKMLEDYIDFEWQEFREMHKAG